MRRARIGTEAAGARSRRHPSTSQPVTTPACFPFMTDTE